MRRQILFKRRPIIGSENEQFRLEFVQRLNHRLEHGPVGIDVSLIRINGKGHRAREGRDDLHQRQDMRSDDQEKSMACLMQGRVKRLPEDEIPYGVGIACNDAH